MCKGYKPEVGPASRVGAVVLAVVWVTVGLMAIGIGVARQRWTAFVLGPVAVWYGFLWVRVARTGRWIWWPWRRL